MKHLLYFIVICLGLCRAIQGNEQLYRQEGAIVFVHIGKELPDYLLVALSQARLFNTCPILVIGNQKALEKCKKTFDRYHVLPIACEQLPRSKEHQFFIRHSKLDRTFRNGFWFVASERFFYLAECMDKYQLSHVIHLESDVMLYANIDHLLPIFKTHYRGLGVTFDTDKRCIPGFVYIRDIKAIKRLTRYMVFQMKKNCDDMYIIGHFKKEGGKKWIDALPIVDQSYIATQYVNSQNPKLFCNYSEQFNSIFDAAYLGQFLGGIDPRNGPIQVGYINPHCVIKVTPMQFDWEKDEMGRCVPYVTYKSKRLRINNLHIHSKQLQQFHSKDRVCLRKT